MCDPVSLSIASTVVGAAGSVASGMGQASAQRKQEKEINLWQQKQKQFREAEKGRQEGLRQQAAASQQEAALKVGGESQKATQKDEEARLADYLMGNKDSTATPEAGVPAVAEADKMMLSGQQGGDQHFQEDLAKKIGDASKGAEQRIKALAGVSSYGGAHLGRLNNLALAQGGQGIDLANEKRRGSLAVQQGAESAIEPVQVTYQPSPLASLFSTALSFGSQGMGAAFGNPLSGGAAGASLPQTTNIIPTAKPWSLPGTTTAIPQWRTF